jgi:septum formation protein
MAVDFAVINPDVDEQKLTTETPLDYVKRIAIAKAQAGKALLLEADAKPVLAADTAVVVEKQVFGKPVNETEAKHILKQLSGRTHQVLTAVALSYAGQTECLVSINDVRFAELQDSDIDWYLSTGEGKDKAGSYAVQGLAALFIDSIQGSYSGIMGLPIRETGQLLKQMDSKREQ